MKISEIKNEFSHASREEWESLIQKHISDERSGVQSIIKTYQNKIKKYELEIERLEKMHEFENKYKAEYPIICGIDEAGRGPLAGPVVAGAVVLPEDAKILYLNDSKKLSASRREELYEEIVEKAIAVGVGIVSPKRIDEINILQATYEAMRFAISDLDTVPNILLNDAVVIPDVHIKQVGIVKGDARSVSIAAASIIAKVTRDRIMDDYADEYPEYGFESHKGYGTAAHVAAIKKYGPLDIHRRTFIGNIVK
ncbi:ribonuclease HII [Eubacterium xylanophilum]|uniref:ribonuclease HII n=1 Tax=Eubacterium xylanophilum TaxID=39497 RepID=UPI0004790313|nr:ribonuclease HII [Eubacterium xylanophilum]